MANDNKVNYNLIFILIILIIMIYIIYQINKAGGLFSAGLKGIFGSTPLTNASITGNVSDQQKQVILDNARKTFPSVDDKQLQDDTQWAVDKINTLNQQDSTLDNFLWYWFGVNLPSTKNAIALANQKISQSGDVARNPIGTVQEGPQLETSNQLNFDGSQIDWSMIDA